MEQWCIIFINDVSRKPITSASSNIVPGVNAHIDISKEEYIVVGELLDYVTCIAKIFVRKAVGYDIHYMK